MEHGLILTLENSIHFFLDPWFFVCQFVEISNQIGTTGEVSNVKQKNLYNAALSYKEILLDV